MACSFGCCDPLQLRSPLLKATPTSAPQPLINQHRGRCQNAKIDSNHGFVDKNRNACCDIPACETLQEDGDCSPRVITANEIRNCYEARRFARCKSSSADDLAFDQQSYSGSSQRASGQETTSTFHASVKFCLSTDSCCVAKNTKASTETTSANTCCSDTKSPVSVDACCKDEEPRINAYFKDKSMTVTPIVRILRARQAERNDPEKGLLKKERVVLSISGMTCTGCETKLSRTLAAFPSITKLKTSLVLSRAEFDVEIGVQSVVEVVKHLERATGFRCERVADEGCSLDLVCAHDSMDIINTDWPSGVSDVRVICWKTLRVNFDATIIGARDLVERGWSNSMSLAPPRADPNLDAGARHVRRMGYLTLASILLTIPVLVLAWSPLPGKERKKIAFGSISLAFATIIQFLIAGPFYSRALKALIFSGVIEMDLLIVLSTSAAYIFSVVAFAYLVKHNPLSTGEFFETSSLLVTLIMVGRFVAALARQKAVESISIRSLQPSSAILIAPDGLGKEVVIDSRLLQYGDVFMVLPDSRIPTDGTVVLGTSEVDESMLTGESRPVEKSMGSSVIAGSINGSGVLTVRLTRIPGENTITTVAAMVDEAKLSKPKIQKLADQVASYFVPIVVCVTIAVFCTWTAVGIISKKPASDATIQAITYAIAVIIVSCPCAIGLAVPMVIVIASGVAAERGVIFKSADAIETAWKTSHVVFDKTGTLTQGKLRVARKAFPNSSVSAKALLIGLVSGSKHPVSVAVASDLRAEDLSATTISDLRNIVGKGVEGTFAGQTLRAGNSRWLNLSNNALVQSILSEGYTAFCFTINGDLAAAYGLEDSLREDALSTVTQLQQSGITVHVLSGDDDGAVHGITTQLTISPTNVRSRCTPADKRDYVNALLATPDPHRSKKSKKSKPPIVMFCGDGTNDAIALAQASIGVHMNEGTDVAQSAADIVLMRPSLAGILVAITISRKSYHRIVLNFAWSFVYNVFAILLAAGAFGRVRIPPEFAGLGELVSVLPVVGVGVMLKWSKI